MLKRSLDQSRLLAFLVIAIGFFLAAPSSMSAARPLRAAREREVRVDMADTGKTVALPVGQRLIVTLPMWRYDDNTWYVVRNSGGGLKLIAGPDEKRAANWTPWDYRMQVFCFKRESPGTVSLVLEQKYFSKPMILKIVD